MAAQGPPLRDRGLVEDAVTLLTAGLPDRWQRLHVELEPSSHPPVVEAEVIGEGGQRQMVPVSPEVLAVVAEHQARATAAGARWRRMRIDVHADGRLSASVDPEGQSSNPRASRRWVNRALAALAVCLLVAAALVFALGWRWGELPRAEMLALPPQSPREQEAFDVLSAWFDAENRGDAAGMSAVTCAHPSQAVQDWITSTAHFGQVGRYVYPDALTAFGDDGLTVWVRASVRLRPISEEQKQLVDMVQKQGGFFSEEITFADEGGVLKVCDILVPPE